MVHGEAGTDGLAVARITHSWWVPGIIVFIVAAPVVWPVLPTVRELRAMKSLRQAKEAIIATATGPVYVVTGLIGGDKGAATELVKALAAEARDNNVTLVGRTEAGVLVRFYERAGFEVVASADAWWGTAVLVVCRRSDSGGITGAEETSPA